MIKCALFDFDGVIVQSEPLHMRTFLELLSPYGVKVSEKRWYNEFAGTGSRHIFEVLVKENGIDEDVDSLMNRRKILYEKYVRQGGLKEVKGATSFVRSIRDAGIKSAVVSGSHRVNVELGLEVLKMKGLFDLVVSGDDLDTKKPDPGPFLYAARKLDTKPEECAVFEDSVSGSEAARRAGMKLIVIKSPALPSVGSYDMLINDFSGLRPDDIRRL